MSQGMDVRKILILAGLVLLAVLLIVSPAQAMETRSGDRVVIDSNEVIDDDLYVAANEVVVNGTIRGDLFAIGNTVTVNGTVEGDLNAAAQSVEVGGTVDDDVRIAGQTLLLNKNARINDDLLAAGFSLENQPDTSVGGTLAYAGYQAFLSGTVGEDLNVAANGVVLDGEVGRNVDANVDSEDGGPPPFLFLPTPRVQTPSVEPGLRLTNSARVGGDLTYKSSTEAKIDPDAQVEGEVVRQARPATEEEPTRTAADVVLDILRSFIALLPVGLLLLWVVPNLTRRLADTVRVRPLPSFGWGLLGFVLFIALAIAILLATILLAVIFGLVTLGGLVLLIIGLGVLAEIALVLVFSISTGYLAQIIVSFLVGRLLLERGLPNRAAGRVLPLVVGLVLYVILRAIPVLGFIVGLVVVLLGLGALTNWIWTTLRRSPSHPPPPR